MKAIGKIMWEILEYLRRAATPFFLDLMFGMTMLAVSVIENPELRLILMFVLVAADGILIFLLTRGVGENAYKMKVTGQLIRENRPTGSSDSGTYRPCKDYRWYKGTVIGLTVCIIPIILVLVGALGENTGARVTLMLMCGWCYMPPFSIYQVAFSNMETEAFVAAYGFSSMWWSFILIGAHIVLIIVAYAIGVSREKTRQYVLAMQTESIEEGIARHQKAIASGKVYAPPKNNKKAAGKGGKKGAKKH